MVSMAAPDSKAVPLNLEVEAPFLELLIFFPVEAVESGGAVSDILLHLIEGDEKVHAQDLLAEVALVERRLQDGLVQPLQLGQRELGRQQLETDRLVAHLVLEPL